MEEVILDKESSLQEDLKSFFANREKMFDCLSYVYEEIRDGGYLYRSKPRLLKTNINNYRLFDKYTLIYYMSAITRPNTRLINQHRKKEWGLRDLPIVIDYYNIRPEENIYLITLSDMLVDMFKLSKYDSDIVNKELCGLGFIIECDIKDYIKLIISILKESVISYTFQDVVDQIASKGFDVFEEMERLEIELIPKEEVFTMKPGKFMEMLTSENIQYESSNCRRFIIRHFGDILDYKASLEEEMFNGRDCDDKREDSKYCLLSHDIVMKLYFALRDRKTSFMGVGGLNYEFIASSMVNLVSTDKEILNRTLKSEFDIMYKLDPIKEIMCFLRVVSGSGERLYDSSGYSGYCEDKVRGNEYLERPSTVGKSRYGLDGPRRKIHCLEDFARSLD